MQVRVDGQPLTDDLGVLQLLSGGGVAWNVAEGPDGEVEATPRPLDHILREGQGLLTETFSRHVATNSHTTTSGTTLFTLMPVVAGQLITNLSIAVITAGVSVTLGKLGLYDTAGNLLAVTASQTTAWQSAGVKTVPLTAPYRVPDTGVVYAAILNVAATGIMIVRCSGQTIASAAVGSGAVPYGTEAGQSDLDATVTITPATGVAAWVGAS